MGPNPSGPYQVSCDRTIRYSGFFGVREVPWVRPLEISWKSKRVVFVALTGVAPGFTELLYFLMMRIESRFLVFDKSTAGEDYLPIFG